MSRTNRAGKPGTVGDSVRHALAQAGPLATNTTTAVRHGVTRSRAWAAPQVERTGEFLQQVAAPKVSAALSSAAHKIEPAQPRRGRWTKRAAAATAGILAAAGAAAAVLRKNVKPAANETADESNDVQAGETQEPRHFRGAEADAESSQHDPSVAGDSAIERSRG
jgi:hypothetical protein